MGRKVWGKEVHERWEDRGGLGGGAAIVEQVLDEANTVHDGGGCNR